MALNKDVERKAIKLVIKYESKKGRNPQEVRGKEFGYDLISGKRKIEVKGADHGEVFKGFVIEEKQKKNFKDPNFWIYRVLNISKKPKILEIKPDEIKLGKKQVRYNATSWKNNSRPRKYDP